jgi:hypothetical protein
MNMKIDTVGFSSVTSVMAAMAIASLATLYPEDRPTLEDSGFQVALQDDADPAVELERTHRVPRADRGVDAVDLSR